VDGGADGIGNPIAVAIPQYAYWTDEHGKKVPVIVIQAEEHQGTSLFGVRDLSGNEIVATDEDLQLVGPVPTK